MHSHSAPSESTARPEVRVQIVYALAQLCVVKSLRVQQGALVANALEQAAADADFNGIDLANATVGIFGRIARKDQALKEGDRIEIYRPLTQEPKVARRERASALKPRVRRR